MRSRETIDGDKPGLQEEEATRHEAPAGQYETRDFPVLTFAPTPRIEKPHWSFEVDGTVENPTKLELHYQAS